MVARTHSLFAFTCLVGVAYYTGTKDISTSTIVACMFFNTIGALLPDIDQASNRLWDLLPAGESIGKALGVFMKHRGISHSFVGIFLADKFSYWLITNLFNENFVDVRLVYWSLMTGFISHIVADSLTEEGVPLLYPLKMNFGLPPIRSWRIKTGGWFENLVVVPVTGLSTIYLLSLYWRR
jgi:inner membrane protein